MLLSPLARTATPDFRQQYTGSDRSPGSHEGQYIHPQRKSALRVRFTRSFERGCCRFRGNPRQAQAGQKLELNKRFTTNINASSLSFVKLLKAVQTPTKTGSLPVVFHVSHCELASIVSMQELILIVLSSAVCGMWARMQVWGCWREGDRPCVSLRTPRLHAHTPHDISTKKNQCKITI
jgi:hypothetical protein